jgi:hypothetical protein
VEYLSQVDTPLARRALTDVLSAVEAMDEKAVVPCHVDWGPPFVLPGLTAVRKVGYLARLATIAAAFDLDLADRLLARTLTVQAPTETAARAYIAEHWSQEDQTAAAQTLFSGKESGLVPLPNLPARVQAAKATAFIAVARWLVLGPEEAYFPRAFL